MPGMCGRIFDTYVDTLDGGQAMSVRCYREDTITYPFPFEEGYKPVSLCYEHVREIEHLASPDCDCEGRGCMGCQYGGIL